VYRPWPKVTALYHEVFGKLGEVRNPSFDVFDLDGLCRVSYHQVRSTKPRGWWRPWVREDLQHYRDRRARRLLQSRDTLPEGRTASLSVGGVEVWLVQPSIKRSGCDFGAAGSVVHRAVRQERGDSFFLLALQFCDISCH
jgi:hypothetical protein